jgi:NADH:ubiquinone oxidoreductase subunit 5 (subunit L)/multisubunit Na+/H+ antiporter MnhA subunit
MVNLGVIIAKKVVFQLKIKNIFIDFLDMHFDIDICFDTLSVLMLTIVVVVSTIVNTYSI